MSKSKVTIKEIAEMAGVSIATVSHVINRTRYVRPELVDKIEKIIVETGYQNKIADKERKLLVGRESTIVAVIPNIESTIYRDMVAYVKQLVSVQGYQFLVAITDNDLKEEAQVLAGLLVNKKVAGIIHAPVSDVASNYTKLIQSGVPFVCVERNILGSGIDSVEFRDREAIFKGADYLLASGHKNVLFFRESTDSTTRDERTKGFLNALEKYNINTNDANIVDVTLEKGEDDCMLAIQKALRRYRPTAVLAGGNRITLYLMKTLRDMGIDCPGEISVVGFGDESWSELTYPPLTILRRDVKGLSAKAVGMLFEKINTGVAISHDCYADVELVVRKSTKMLDNGPFGDKAAAPDSVVLTKEEKHRLKTGHFRVAISFHYTGTSWAELHEKGIREELEQFGIDVVSVMDAHFDSELQNAQLDGIRLQKPDAVIAIPADDSRTREKFQELSKVSKLVFISNVPDGMSKNSYVSCVSVNESENGTNTGRMLGEYCKENKKKKAGFIIHGAAFYGTRVRDNAAERIIKDSYPDIDIVTIRSFANPEIEAMYVSWDRPALLTIKALKELGREDVAVFTTDLDHGIARCMEEGIVKGLSTQRPYEQGRAAAAVVAKSLVSEEQLPKYVGVQPYQVEPKQLRLAWKEIFHESMPDRLG